MNLKFRKSQFRDQIAYMEQFMDEFGEDDSFFEIDMKKFRKKRSLDQNAYMWVICTIIGEHLGLSKERVYRMLAAEYAIDLIKLPNGKIKAIAKDPKEMDTVDFGQLITQAKQWAQDELNISIKSPEDWKEDELRQIRNNYEKMFY